jgi:hypothetical protein
MVASELLLLSPEAVVDPHDVSRLTKIAVVA